jgi:hypothetical protein
MANNITDNGLFIMGTYDATTSTLNWQTTTTQINGVTATSGTFSGGGALVVTVVDGLITRIA